MSPEDGETTAANGVGEHTLVTGGAGFIGSHVVDALVDRGATAVVLDDLSGGLIENLAHHGIAGDGDAGEAVSFVEARLQDRDAVVDALEGVDTVYHVAADPVVKGRKAWPDPDLEATMTLLDAMEEVGVGRIAFTSTSTVYGEAAVLPTPEDYGPLAPISFYGASKLAQEAYLFAADHSYGFDTWAFRFANIIGPRQTHGVIVDFLAKVAKDPTRLEVLGDGRQRKSYLDVRDCADAILLGVEQTPGEQEALNIGSRDAVSVMRIAEIVLEETGLEGKAEIETTGGERGWVGDVPKMQLAIDAIEALGFAPRFTSEEAVRETTRWLIEDGHGPEGAAGGD